MNHREKVEFFASIADSYAGDPDAAEKIAAEIRSHVRVANCTKEEVYKTHLAHPDWTTRQIADHLSTGVEFVNQCAQRGSWSPRRLTSAEKGEIARRTASKPESR